VENLSGTAILGVGVTPAKAGVHVAAWQAWIPAFPRIHEGRRRNDGIMGFGGRRLSA
jgi:hypothetical protein